MSLPSTKTLHITPSEEQQRILEYVAKGHNVVGDCVAGSGKTTSVLLLSESFPDKQILQITYNSQLKFEVRKKAELANLKNLEIHTYHSLAVRYYNGDAHTDDAIRAFLERNVSPRRPIPPIDIAVLDEAQDMTNLYYRLIKKFLSDSKKPVKQMVVLGDKYQGVYRFIGADSRYLTLCSNIWSREFIPFSLNTSYRVTRPIAKFVNEVMLGQERIKAVKDGPRVTYITCSVFDIHSNLAAILLNKLKSGSIKPDDIFVLNGSIKGQKCPMRKLENALVANGVLCYYPVSDERTLDEDIIEGKVVFSTFHQAKGRERKIVIVYGFDESYYTYYGSDFDRDVCPETLYVATTRAKERLILLHHYQNAPLPFLRKSLPEIAALPYIEYLESKSHMTKSPSDTFEKEGPIHRVTPSELVKFLKESNIALLTTIMKQIFTVEQAAFYEIKVPSKMEFEGGNYEDISDINGIAIPAMYEARGHKESQIETVVRQEYDNIVLRNEFPYLQAAYKRIGLSLKSTAGFVRLTIMYISLTEKIFNKIQQITKHDWLTTEMVEGCFLALDRHISKKAKFEHAIEYECANYAEYGRVAVSGRLDTMDDDVILELKATDTLTIEHQLQLVLYAWMWNNVNLASCGSRIFKLINMRTGQVMRLNPISHLLDEAVLILFHNKYAKNPIVTDETFVAACHDDSAPLTPKRVCLIVDEDE